jgi:ATP-binding cassette subfamily B protein
MYEKLWNAGKNIRAVYESISDANEMTALLIQPRSIVDKEGAGALDVKNGEIVFENMSFKYGQREIMKDFNLSIKAGERVAFVGPSGGGKSTILKLLFRFYDLSGGKITIDGQNIAEVTQDSLRQSLSLVPQDPILFHRPLIENIRYARQDATDEEVIRASKLAHAHEFIEKSQHGYQTMVGERGIKLSGGERQRIAIARAILKDAPILILDEATSSLDSESEMLIQDALNTLMKGRTTIVVAHRLSTIMAMDRIVVIKDGTIVEEGKHDELLKAEQGMYQKLWEIQAGGFVKM